MKEIERYKITSANGNSSNVTKCDDGHWVNYADIVDFIGGTYKTIHNLEKDNYELKDNLKCVEEGNIKLQARIKELESAERTLITLGYENKGGSLWKPPLGKKPDFSLIDKLNKRIEDLDLLRKKTFKAGSDYFNQLQEVEKHCNELAQKIKELESQSHINEIKAMGIEEAINEANHEMHEIFDNEFHVSLHVANLRIFVDRLRTKHD